MYLEDWLQAEPPVLTWLPGAPGSLLEGSLLKSQLGKDCYIKALLQLG